jgi:hypothetical protein
VKAPEKIVKYGLTNGSRTPSRMLHGVLYCFTNGPRIVHEIFTNSQTTVARNLDVNTLNCVCFIQVLAGCEHTKLVAQPLSGLVTQSEKPPLLLQDIPHGCSNQEAQTVVWSAY